MKYKTILESKLEGYFGNADSQFLKDLSEKYLGGVDVHTIVFYDKDDKELNRLDKYSFRNIVWDFLKTIF